MRLIVVRHGQTQWNHEKRALGHADVELNEEGRRQAQWLALALKEEKLVAIYSSPLKRALETAQAIARFHQAEVGVDRAFIEMDVGEMDGLTYEEMRDRYGEFLKEWMKGSCSLALPGGECLEDVQRRAWLGVEKIIKEHLKPEDVVAVVSHNFTILCIICRALGLELSQFRRLRLNLASISVLDFGGRGTTLVRFNDTCHLPTGVDQ